MSPIALQRSVHSTAQGAESTLPPKIVSTRRMLDDRFPVLGFNVYYDRPGFGEVLLATDLSLFDPSNAGRRTPANFYSSRQDSRLIPIQFGTAVYLVPAAVLKGFAHAVPRPSEIYYTLVVYPGADGVNGVFAQPPETLPGGAPSVALSPHFGSDGVHDVLGMSPDRLQRVQPVAAHGASLAAPFLSPEEDRAEGEDGTTAPPLAAPAPSQSASAGFDDCYADESAAAPGASRAAPGGGYQDGYAGEPPQRSRVGLGAAQQASFRADEPEPAVLEDDGADTDLSASSASSRTAASLRFDDDDEEGERYGGGWSARDGDSGGQRGYFRQSDGSDDERDGGESPGVFRASAVGLSAEANADDDDWMTAGTEPRYQSLSTSSAAPTGTTAPPLTIEAKRDLIGKLGDYSAVSADAEFNGVFGPEHPAFRRWHLGLSFGVAMFNQDAGHLGQLLSMMRQRDTARFDEIFGADAAVLCRVTNAAGPSSAESDNGRSPRVQQVANADLWEEPWLTRFREAAMPKPFQSVQNQLAAALFLEPMLHFAAWMGMNTERALAILMDRAAHLGVQPAQEWVANAAGALQTPVQRHQALATLGFDSIRALQHSRPGTESNGQWGPLTHAAAMAALRMHGASPVPIPTLDQMLDALVRRSAQTPWSARVIALRNDVRFGDVPLDLTSGAVE